MMARTPSYLWLAGRLIANQPLLYAVNALCWILYHTWPILTGLLAKLFFDLLAGRAPAGLNLATLVALVVAAGLGKAGVIFTAERTGAPYRFRQRALLQRNLLAEILRRPGARALPGSPGEALATLRDDVAGTSEISDWLFDALAALLFAGGALAVLFTVNARVTLLVFAPVVVVIALAHGVRIRLVQARAESRAAAARVTERIGELFGAVQAIQVAGAEGRVVAHLARLGAAREQTALRDRLQSLWLDGLFESTASLGAGLVLLVAAGQMRAGSFTVGDFALFATYLMTVVEFTAFVGYLINTYRQAGVAIRRTMALMQGAPPERLVARSAPATAAAVRERLERLEVTGLTCIHPESGRGIRDLSFTLERGSLTVVTGRVGAGKTTLLRALLGLLERQAGQIRWNGRLVDDPASFLAPPRVAYTPQVPTLLPGTLRENILLGGPGDLAEAVRLAVLERDLAGFPQGLETVVGARGMRLSGGQIQRVAAARMFVREPELLVFDDLSSALDIETEAALWERLFARGATCLAVSHRPEVLRRADQIIRLDPR
ncbi:MAG: ATP-binding cassette domain-containing protein [Bacillota bacterium]